jgi:hypothetical protein
VHDAFLCSYVESIAESQWIFYLPGSDNTRTSCVASAETVVSFGLTSMFAHQHLVCPTLLKSFVRSLLTSAGFSGTLEFREIPHERVVMPVPTLLHLPHLLLLELLHLLLLLLLAVQKVIGADLSLRLLLRVG